MPPVLSKCLSDWPCSACLRLKCIFARYSTGDTCVSSFSELNGETLIVLDSPTGTCPADLPKTSGALDFLREHFTAEVISAIFNACEVVLSIIGMVGVTVFVKWFRKWALRMEESSIETQSLLLQSQENSGVNENGAQDGNEEGNVNFMAEGARRQARETAQQRQLGTQRAENGTASREFAEDAYHFNSESSALGIDPHRAAAVTLQNHDRRRNLLEDYGQNEVAEANRSSPVFGGFLDRIRFSGWGRKQDESGYIALLGNSSSQNATSTPPRQISTIEERGLNPFASTPMPQVHLQRLNLPVNNAVLIGNVNPPPIPARPSGVAVAGPSRPTRDLLQMTGTMESIPLDSDDDEEVTQIENPRNNAIDGPEIDEEAAEDVPRSRYGRPLKQPQRLGME